VDDESVMRELLTEVFYDQGFAVETLNDGIEVLKKLEDKKIGLVLTDIRMPNYDGLQVLKDIKNKKIPVKVILMTGYALDNTGQEYLNLGAFGFILKPFDINQIRNLVLEAFEAKASEKI
jgi:DNA-binding NtrC family response regulator